MTANDPAFPVGAVGIIPHPYLHDAHVIVRVEKARKTGGMWDVSQLNYAGEWERPVRRKIARFMPLPGGADYIATRAELVALANDLRAKEKALRAEYHAAVALLSAGEEG